jgi:hypothetical protein
MADKPTAVVCTICAARSVSVRTAIKFPGCPQYRCPSCGGFFLYPMTTANLVVGWLLAAGLLFSAARTLLAGGIPLPGLAVIALVMDVRIRAAVAKAKARA